MNSHLSFVICHLSFVICHTQGREKQATSYVMIVPSSQTRHDTSGTSLQELPDVACYVWDIASSKC
ncbi:hypothetical protein [Coleofasciculus sp. F4-SAH-05]|uniref:hypothetical protein n=1 Tax=Coleofasciculus sp. F4-SAH-05 TaxID=3069525 RepID=UPI0033037D69